MARVAALGRLAQGQWGMVTTRQAADTGVSRMQLSRMAAVGVLERLAQGIYRMTGAPEHEHEEILTAWLAVSDGTVATRTANPVVVAGVAAARLHGIGDLWVDRIDLITRERRSSRNPRVRLQTRVLPAGEVTLVDGAPLLTPMRTIADLVDRWTDLSLVADVLRDAHEKGLADLRELARYLAPLAERDGFAPGDGAAFAEQLAVDAGLVLG